jgi:hypothetical protein
MTSSDIKQPLISRVDLDHVRQAFAAYRGLGKTLIDSMVAEIEETRARGARMTDADRERLELLRENHEYDPGERGDDVTFLLRLLLDEDFAK